mgnify:CR=1 FL=1
MVKTLLNEVKEYKKDTLLSPIYVSIEAILEVFIPFLMALLVDNGIEKGNMGSIWFYGTLMLVAAFVSLWAGAKSGKHAAIASSGFAKNLRKAEYRNIQNFSFSNIDAYSTSGLITYDDGCDKYTKCISDDYSCLCSCTIDVNRIFDHGFYH